jgi:hypothetical protein
MRSLAHTDRRTRPLLRLLAPIALAVALAAPLADARPAAAQFGRTLPSPVPATQFAEFLASAGLPATAKDIALPLHEAYFARFREFEEREVKPAFDTPGTARPAMNATLEAARRESDALRRTFARAAQIDGQLVDELAGLLPSDDALKLERLRHALARRRAALLSPPAIVGESAVRYDLLAAPVFKSIDDATRNSIAPTLDAYEQELTRLAERYAEAAIERPVRVAELREKEGAPPFPGATAENAASGEEEAAPGDPSGRELDQKRFEEWLNASQDITRRASAELADAETRLRRLHRDTISSLAPVLKPAEARLLRRDLVSKLYASTFTARVFDELARRAESMRADGKIDDAKWSAASAIIEAHELNAWPVLDDILTLVDKRLADNGGSMPLFEYGRSSDSKDPSLERLESLKQDYTARDATDTRELRLALGLDENDANPGRGVTIRGLDGAIVDVVGEAVGGVAISAVAVDATGGSGEVMILSGDDLGDSGGMFFGPGPGMQSRTAREMTGAELDALATRLGFDGAARASFDEIAARCREARKAASDEAPAAQQLEIGGGGEGSVSFTIAIGEDGEAGGFAPPDPAKIAKLREAIDAAEETMFDELAAVAAADRTEAVEAARRARARVRLTGGTPSKSTVDLVSVAETAALDDAARASIAAPMRDWDLASVENLRALQAELARLDAERQEIWALATKEVRTDDGNGNVSVNRTLEMDGETGERLQKVDESSRAVQQRAADANQSAFEAMRSALGGNDAAQRALTRSYARATNPAIYKMPRDLAPFYEKALAIEGVSDATRGAIEVLRAEWIEERESRCLEFIESRDRDAAERERSARASGAATPPPGGLDIQSMQAQMRERKKLREDLEQLEATAHRRLVDLLAPEVGADKAASIGELPAKRRGAMPTFQFGG